MDATKHSLEGKVALITGGSRGIGRATALLFADAGADVVITSRKLPELEAVAGEIKAKGRRGLPVAADMARLADLKKLVERVMAELGRIDILFNNAGVTYRGPLVTAEEWLWDATMNVNLKGLFFLSQMVVPIMKKQGGGNIINVSSVGGIQFRGNGIYSASKAGLIMLGKAMAQEWGQYGIRVNTLAPGTTRTPFNEPLWKDPVKAKERGKAFALGRIAEPEDIAKVALCLASDASSHMTGAVVTVDGGMLVGASPFPDPLPEK